LRRTTAHSAVQVKARVAGFLREENAKPGAERPLAVGAVGDSESGRPVVHIRVDETIAQPSIAGVKTPVMRKGNPS
jgi:hypothetical protein